MNYIKRLEQTEIQMTRDVWELECDILDIALYLRSDKFQGTENDYIHVSTDILPKINALLYKCRSITD